MNEQPIILHGDFTQATVTPSEGITVSRDKAITYAKRLSLKIEDAEQLKTQSRAYRDLSDLEKAVEDACKTVKRPIDALGKLILRTKEDFLSEVVKLKAQIQGRINHYQSHQLEEQRELEKRAQRGREAAEAEARKAAKEAELLKRDLTKAEMTGDTKSVEALEMALLEKELAADVIVPPAPQSLATEVRGVSSRQVLDYRLKGATEVQQLQSLHIFAKSHPDLCRIEIKRAELLKLINSPENEPDTIPEIAGLEVFRTTKTSIR